MPYGITNNGRAMPQEQAVGIIRTAIEQGVGWIDTARAYGEAEARVGHALARGAVKNIRIVTKLSLPNARRQTASPLMIRKAAEESLRASLSALRADTLDVLMIHRWEDYSTNGSELRTYLMEAQDRGRIRELGVSVYSPEEATNALDYPEISHLQVPFNLLDHRWRDERFTHAVAQRPDAMIHVRSVFLQGLLLNDGSKWPAWCGDRFDYTDRLLRLVAELERESVADLCIAYVKAHCWVSQIILGLINSLQLTENLWLLNQKSLLKEEVEYVRSAFPNVPERLIDPRKW